jgi:hypothetical protein
MKTIAKNTMWEDMSKRNKEFAKLMKHFEAFKKSENSKHRGITWPKGT